MNLYDKASLILTPNAYKASKIYVAKPTDGSGDLTFSRASTAMRRNAAGLWESVANNVPRLHYPVGGGCPAWLMEPFATNIVWYSTALTEGYWGKTAVSVVTTTVSTPFKDLTAFLIYPTSSGSNRTIDRAVSFSNGVAFTTSLYIKAAGLQWFRFFGINAASNLDAVWFDLINGVVGQVGANITGSSIKALEDGWYHITITQTTVGTSGTYYGGPVDANGSGSVTVSGTNGFYIIQPQAEVGSAATSPIITAGSTVTRLGDEAANMSKIFSLADFTINFSNATISVLNNTMFFGKNGVPNPSYIYFTTSHIYFKSDTGVEVNMGNNGLSLNATYDLTIRRLGSVVSYFVNGLPILSSTIDALPFTLGALFVSKDGGGNSYYIRGQFGNVKLYETALTNAEILALNS